MLKTRHHKHASGIKTLGIDAETGTGGISVALSHSVTGSFYLDFQFTKIEDLQALMNEARALLDEWMVDELESGEVGNNVD